MKKKILLMFTMALLLPIIAQARENDTTTIDDVLWDTYVDDQNDNTNFGTDTELRVRQHTSQGRITYVMWNISEKVPHTIEIHNTTACLYLFQDGLTWNISAYHVLNRDWNGETETTMTWNNQVCGTGFDNSTNCNLTPLDAVNTTGIGWHCWNITDAWNVEWNNSETNLTIAFKTPLLVDKTTGDIFRSREYGSLKPTLNVTHCPLTDLELNFSDIFVVNTNNLVQANYSTDEDGLPVLNATCNISFEGDSVLMAYNNSTTYYEAYVIPIEIGIFNFSVNCSKYIDGFPYEAQVENASTTVNFISAYPYNFTLNLWENKNATTKFLDEFSFILMVYNDLNCTLVTGNVYCMQNARYKNGQANFTPLYFEGNFSVYYYSGELTFATMFSYPRYHSFNDFVWLGEFIIEDTADEPDELHLWINPAELNFWVALKAFLLTWGLLIFAFLIAFGGALALYFISGNSISVALLAFILILWFFSFLGWLPQIALPI